jgi:ABC-2 type transport system permease protein
MKASVKIERIWEVMRKEFLQIRRDPRLWRVILVAPIIQLVIFGYAVSTDVRHTKTFVVDHDQSRSSREFLEAFTSSDYFRIVGHSDRPADLIDALDHADAVVGIEIPAGFAKSIHDGSGADVQILLDGTNSNIASVARGYAERIVQNYNLRVAATQRPVPVDLRERAWYNPDLASRNYNVPGVIGLIILLVCQLLTSLAIVREREIGTLEQLMVSPLTPGELIIGKTLPFGIIGLFDLVLISTVAMLWFGVPLEGSVVLLFSASVLFLLSGLGVGLLISTISNTQQEAFMVSFLIFMPVVLLSGFMFPVSSMPVFFQWVTLINPLRHYLVIVRGIFLKGSGLAVLWPQYLGLLVMGVGVLAVATKRFHKTVG